MPRTPIKFEAKLKVRSGDTVKVLAGKDAGKTGVITRVYPKTGKVIVEGVNFVTKHQKAQPTPADPNPTGGKVVVEAPILASKVALVNANGEATRIRTQVVDGKKVRVAVKGGQVI
ncbi:MAG: 50S ribosomal protein L24 [Armatimonadota bacterium]